MLTIGIKGMFSVLCTVTANTSRMTKGLKPLLDKQGNVYFRQYYDIVLLFGLTELKAQISWTENVRLYFSSCLLYRVH